MSAAVSWRFSAFTACALVCSLVSAPADAQTTTADGKRKLVHRRARFGKKRGWATMSVAWRDVVNAKIRTKLLSGLPTLIVSRAYIFSVKSSIPVGLSVKTCRVVFDLWDEVFRIDLRENGRVKNAVAVNIKGVLRQCAEARHMPLLKWAALTAKQPHFVGMLIEVNPLSPKMLDHIKRWVSRPRGTASMSAGDSLFGSFVGLFITRVPDADRVLKFRTQTFLPDKLIELVPPSRSRPRDPSAKRFSLETWPLPALGSRMGSEEATIYM